MADVSRAVPTAAVFVLATMPLHCASADDVLTLFHEAAGSAGGR